MYQRFQITRQEEQLLSTPERSLPWQEALATSLIDLKVTGSVVYPSALAVFVTEGDFREIFDKDEDYFTGYFSNDKLTDIEDRSSERREAQVW